MRRLSERTVQEKAIEHLRMHYNREKQPESKLFCRDEVVTKDGMRADGFFCFHSDCQPYHAVSLEAKSHKTLNAITPKWNDRRMLKRIVVYSILGVIFTIPFTYSLSWYWILLSIITVVIAVFLGYVIYSELAQPSRHKTTEVYNQIAKYPANEQWLAVSSDSLKLINQRNNEFKHTDREILVETCENKGIGLIIVNQRSVSVALTPIFKKGNFLGNYMIAESIKSALDRFN